MIEIRSCKGTEELDACVQLEVDTWGYDATEIIPRKTFLLAQKIGGQVIGAFRREQTPETDVPFTQLIGFAMSLPGIKTSAGNSKPYLHSHMLAVRNEHRNSGIGLQLKQEQRREALARGISHMEWTFDPLEIKNGYLNIHRLGAVCRTYRANFYGVSSSRLQGGLPTDRLLAEWELNSPRVQAHLDGHPTGAQNIDLRVVVPASVEEWKSNEQDRHRALAVQTENRQKFEQAFARGLAVIGFSRDSQGNGIFELGPLTDSVKHPTSSEASRNI